MADMLKHALFDMDGVIVDSESLHVAAEIATCRANGFDIDEESWDGFKGRTADAIFSHLITQHGDPEVHTVDGLITQKTDTFLELASKKLEPIEGVVGFLHDARELYETVSLVTSSNRRVQEFVVDQLGIRYLFDHVVTGDDIINGKPDPEPYLRALGFADAQPEESVVIEDSVSGIQSALGAGCMVLAIATSHTVAELENSGATFIAGSYADARRQLFGYSAA